MFSGNYTFGFLSTQNSNLLHLTQWQYWFWFFFTWFFGLYYIIFINFFLKRSLNNNPKISTSFRSHGKWGDLIVCLVPISWCLNILTNSNFILRLVEWQSESSCFNLKVRGKQWYWVYKITNTNTFFKDNLSYSVGLNNWVFFGKKDQKIFLSLFNSKVRSEDQYDYFKFHKSYKDTNFLGNSYIFKIGKEKRLPLYERRLKFSLNHTLFNPNYSSFFQNNISKFSSGSLNISQNYFNSKMDIFYEVSYYNRLSLPDFKEFKPLQIRHPSVVSSFFSYSDEYEFKPTNKSFYTKNFSKKSLFQDNFSFFKPSKQILKNLYYIVKQKRFVFKSYHNNFFNKKNSFMHPNSNLESRLSSKLFFKVYVNNKRLLRTFRLLVLPTNVNIAVTTNSFDVIHSWFIPGLGLKLDCVPGRSTHHTLHITNPGFYYGQCAEICGRYHHHMPIRIAALQYPHFVFWWHNKGIRQLINLRTSRKFYSTN